MITTINFIDPRSGQPWTARLITEGERHGLNLCLTAEGKPTVAFYDRRYEEKFAEQNGGNLWGQFVSSYYVDTLRADVRGIDLHGGVPSWKLSDEAMQLVHAWLDNVYPDSATWAIVDEQFDGGIVDRYATQAEANEALAGYADPTGYSIEQVPEPDARTKPPALDDDLLLDIRQLLTPTEEP